MCAPGAWAVVGTSALPLHWLHHGIPATYCLQCLQIGPPFATETGSLWMNRPAADAGSFEELPSGDGYTVDTAGGSGRAAASWESRTKFNRIQRFPPAALTSSNCYRRFGDEILVHPPRISATTWHTRSTSPDSMFTCRGKVTVSLPIRSAFGNWPSW